MAGHSTPAPSLPRMLQIVLCACPPTAADTIADDLVGARLAACVSVLPGMRSTYRWQGAIERSDEALLVIKTQASRVPAVTERILALHPYELPEVIAVEAAGGLPAYLAWAAAEVHEED